MCFPLKLCFDLSKVFSLVFGGSENLPNEAELSSLAMHVNNTSEVLARETIFNLKIFKAIMLFWVRGSTKFLFLFFSYPNNLCAFFSFLSSWSELLKDLCCIKGMNNENISYGLINLTLKSCDMLQTHL